MENLHGYHVRNIDAVCKSEFTLATLFLPAISVLPATLRFFLYFL